MHKKTRIVAFLSAVLFVASFSSFYTTPDRSVQTQFSQREEKIKKKVFSQVVFFRNYVKDSFLLAVSREQVDTVMVRRAFWAEN